MSTGCFSSGDSRRESMFLLFPASRAANSPWLAVSSQICKASNIASLCFFFPDGLFLPPSTFKVLCDYIRPTQIIQENLLIKVCYLNNLNFFLLLCYLTQSWVPDYFFLLYTLPNEDGKQALPSSLAEGKLVQELCNLAMCSRFKMHITF